MLPLDEHWYRRLLLVALALGAAGGVFALIYSGVTGWSIDLFFGEPTSEPFSGQWWWVPLVSGGALIVAFLRARTGVAGQVPGAIAMAAKGWVEPSTATALVAISAISLMVGASLGPSFGIIVSAGGLASWLASRRKDADESERQETTLTGMAGGLGAVFSAPLFASVMTSELSPTPKRNYVAAFLPQFIAAIIGYVVFFGVTGKVMLDSFAMGGYTHDWWHLLVAPALGIVAVVVLIIFSLLNRAVRHASTLIPNPYLRAVVFGALVGLIAFALPLAAAGGNSQLAYESQQVATLGVGLLVVVMIAKIVAVALSQQAGFLGGTVFPMLFVGGTAGMIVNGIVPEIPAALAVASMLAAVPGAIIGAPVSFVLIGVGTVGLGVEAIAPIGTAVITAHIGASALRLHKQRAHM